MSPEYVIIWSCVVIFILTSILTLLHVSGIRVLPNPDHGKILFKALIVEIVIIAVASFANYLTTTPTKFKPTKFGMVAPVVKKGMEVKSSISINDTKLSNNLDKIKTIKVTTKKNIILGKKTGDDCNEITIIDSSTFPPTSKIETVCEEN